MQNYIFLLPLYNDWRSLKKLLVKINNQIKKIGRKASILIIDDGSTQKENFSIKSFKNIKKIKILSLNKNLGSQKAIAIGLKYLNTKKQKPIITILDSDGEDDPSQIAKMIEKANLYSQYVIVSCRTKRGEGIVFSWFYTLHKILTFIFTLKWINFGNYSSFNSKNLKKILKNNSSWLAYSSTISKNCQLKRVYAARKKRFFGQSKLSLPGLILHSYRVNSVFILRSFFLSISYIFFLLLFNLNLKFTIILLLLLVLHNFFLLFTLISNQQIKFENFKNFIKNK